MPIPPLDRRPWREELDIIDRTMKLVSGITDPDKMVAAYWDGIHELMPVEDFVSLSRRGMTAPEVLITRSSRFTEHFNPWTQRERLPRISSGLLCEIAYADAPVIIEDLPARLAPDDPGWFYLQGFQTLVALPNYDEGKALNVGISLFPPGSHFQPSMAPMMHWQASLFGRGTYNLVLRNELQSALAKLDRELRTVGEIQRSLLPQQLPEIPGFALAADYETSARAGGDYYDFFPLEGDAWGVFIADVSGHGTPAAVLMAITHAIAHTRPGRPRPPRELLTHINAHLARSYTTSGTFVTAFYATLDPASRHVVYSTAGHNPPRLVRDGRVISLEASSGLPLGIFGDAPFDEAGFTMEKGDLMLLYTDGITEAMAPINAAGVRDQWGVGRLDDLLVRCAAGRAAPGAVIDRIRAEVAAFTQGTPATDDRTLIAIGCS